MQFISWSCDEGPWYTFYLLTFCPPHSHDYNDEEGGDDDVLPTLHLGRDHKAQRSHNSIETLLMSYITVIVHNWASK